MSFFEFIKRLIRDYTSDNSTTLDLTNKSDSPATDSTDPSRSLSDAGCQKKHRPAQMPAQLMDKSESFENGDEPIILEIRDVLDLHAVPPRQITEIVEEYLKLSHERGFRYVRLIHGKGIGVQREIVRSILQRTEFVTTFSDAPAEAGGWGATIAGLSIPETDNHPSDPDNSEQLPNAYSPRTFKNVVAVFHSRPLF
jgi:DNA-nicking Smr family endonuclease